MANVILQELRKYVDERKNLQYAYVQTKEDGTVSYDAIGFIANKLGFSNSFLKYLSEFSLEYHLDCNKSEEFHSLISEMNKQGFDNSDLIEMQELNDTAGSVDELLELIDKMIEEL